mmetsp:Transcript_12351/g.28933  ORF Transcript_12351/g.28933 Transcript_12351/m.28933 type:complete len:298 (+) Transcript_12351:273-1166(+)
MTRGGSGRRIATGTTSSKGSAASTATHRWSTKTPATWSLCPCEGATCVLRRFPVATTGSSPRHASPGHRRRRRARRRLGVGTCRAKADATTGVVSGQQSASASASCNESASGSARRRSASCGTSAPSYRKSCNRRAKLPNTAPSAGKVVAPLAEVTRSGTRGTHATAWSTSTTWSMCITTSRISSSHNLSSLSARLAIHPSNTSSTPLSRTRKRLRRACTAAIWPLCSTQQSANLALRSAAGGKQHTGPRMSSSTPSLTRLVSYRRAPRSSTSPRARRRPCSTAATCPRSRVHRIWN